MRIVTYKNAILERRIFLSPAPEQKTGYFRQGEMASKRTARLAITHNLCKFNGTYWLQLMEY